MNNFHVAQNKAKRYVDFESISFSAEDDLQHVTNVTIRLLSLSVHLDKLTTTFT